MIHGRVNIGRKTTMFARELVIFGLAYCLSAKSTAVLLSNHFFINSYAASMITTTVSIHIPKLSTNEKLVKKLSVYP
ncbi:hypothetical protein KBB05_04975 [Patescibacteria group bacterium]|nr:hypothetical protein [Patescibacteria group bacterium]